VSVSKSWIYPPAPTVDLLAINQNLSSLKPAVARATIKIDSVNARVISPLLDLTAAFEVTPPASRIFQLSAATQ
jgi:hypothetical protein